MQNLLRELLLDLPVADVTVVNNAIAVAGCGCVFLVAATREVVMVETEGNSAAVGVTGAPAVVEC